MGNIIEHITLRAPPYVQDAGSLDDLLTSEKFGSLTKLHVQGGYIDEFPKLKAQGKVGR